MVGRDRLALSRGQARQLLAHTLMKDVSRSTRPYVLNSKYVSTVAQQFKSAGRQVVIPTTRQTDSVVDSEAVGSGRQLAAACAGPCC